MTSALRLPLLVIVAIGPSLFLIGQGREFPMDDTYIHFEYARNLADTGKLEFNRGEFRGLGTTSLLWVLLLAGGYKLGIPLDIAVRILGIASLLIAALCVWALARPAFGDAGDQGSDIGAFATAGLFALSGNIVWFALSGMETMLFLALGLLTLLCYQRGVWWGVGLGIGLATICRPEGLALAPTIGMLELIRLRKGGAWQYRGWALAALLAAIPIGAWFCYCHAYTGHWLPTTFAGKRIAQLDAVQHFMAAIPALSLYTGSGRVLFVLFWITYPLRYVFGIATVPGPAFSISQDVGMVLSFGQSIIGIVIVAIVVLPLLALGVRRLMSFARRALTSDTGMLACVGVWVWGAIHNGAYLALLPNSGTATRYQAINHLLLWWLVALGLYALRPRRRLFAACAVVVALLVIADLGYWRGTYAANLAHMERARIEAARYLANELPPTARVAAYDIGALRYYGGKPIVDLGGLTDAEFTKYQLEHRVDEYLRDRGADYLALPERHSSSEGALYDFAKYLGIDESPLYELKLVADFEIERELWQRGNEATANYQPSVRVYEIEWRDHGRKSGTSIGALPFSADSWAQMPGSVMSRPR